MIIEDLRNEKKNKTFDCFPRGLVLVKKIDPNEFFIKTDTTDEGNAMYLDNGELFFVDNNEICCEVKHKLIIEE